MDPSRFILNGHPQSRYGDSEAGRVSFRTPGTSLPITAPSNPHRVGSRSWRQFMWLENQGGDIESWTFHWCPLAKFLRLSRLGEGWGYAGHSVSTVGPECRSTLTGKVKLRRPCRLGDEYSPELGFTTPPVPSLCLPWLDPLGPYR